MARRAPALAVVLLVVAAGCLGGPGPADTPTPADAPTQTAPPTTPASPTPVATRTPDRADRTEFRVSVVRVIDGDTIEIRYAAGETDTVRLLGVDTPEVSRATDPADWPGIPDTPAGRAHLESWGDAAESFAERRLEPGEAIRLVVDPQADRRDVYGRLLAYVYDDGELFNRVLLERGYAQLYETRFSKRSAFADAEAAAREREVGVWAFDGATPAGTPTATAAATAAEAANGRAGNLAIAEIHADAAGNDHENRNDEYLVLENPGDEALDLSGWRVEDEAGHSYGFPAGFTLDPGARVTLYTGSGPDTDTALYWGSDRAIWNNGGDTISVFDAAGAVVIERTYDG